MNEIYFILLMFISLPICSAINVLEVWKPSSCEPKIPENVRALPSGTNISTKIQKNIERGRRKRDNKKISYLRRVARASFAILRYRHDRVETRSFVNPHFIIIKISIHYLTIP